MPVTEDSIQAIQAYIRPLLGQVSWGIKLGVGSFLTLEFGNLVSATSETERAHGEWHLWLTYCAWRLEKADTVLACSEDSRDRLESIIPELNGLALESIELSKPAWDTVFRFQSHVILRTFSMYSEEFEHWMLYTPEGKVLSIGPGIDWFYHDSSSVSD